jgi:hypothetical protein
MLETLLETLIETLETGLGPLERLDLRDVRDVDDSVYCIRVSSSSNKYTSLRLYESPLIRVSSPPMVHIHSISFSL